MDYNVEWPHPAGSTRAGWLLRSMPVGFITWDRDWRCTAVNPEGERLCGKSSQQLLGNVLWQLFPSVVGTEFESVYRRVAASGIAESVEIYYPDPLHRWLDIYVNGDEAGVAAYFLDASSRHEAEQLLELSIEFGDQLVDATEVDEAMIAMGRSLVPRLADWAIVSLRELDGSFRDVCATHVDPQLQPVLEQYMHTRLDRRATLIATQLVD